MVDKHPDTVTRFLKGWFMTVQYAKTHKAETIASTKVVLKESDAVLSKLYDNDMPDSQTVISQLSALGLSPRETEVLYWISQGKRNKEIATILNLSIDTVKTHIKSIFHRLGVETRTAAAAAVIPFIKS